MNILHISRSMGQGGAQKIVYQLCENNSSGYKHFVVSSGGNYVSRLEEIGVSHFEIPDITAKNPITAVKTLFKINKIVNENNIDVIHSHHRMAALYARLISMLKPKVKRVYTAHNVFYNKKRLTRFSLTGSEIVAVGKGVRQNLIDFYSLDSKNIIVIHNAVENKKLEKPNMNAELEQLKKEGYILIGSIGRLSEQKGMDVFLKGLKKLLKQKQNKKIMAIIIGDGEEREYLKELSIQLDISENVLFLGYQNNIFELISQLDFVVLASRWEGLPLTPIETFSVGKTIVASDIPGNNEVVKDGATGLLFEVENDQELANKMEFLIDNPSEKISLEKEAMIFFNKTYDYKKFQKNYTNLYDNIINSDK